MPTFLVIFKYQEGSDVSLHRSPSVPLTVIIVNSYHGQGTVLNTPCILTFLVLKPSEIDRCGNHPLSQIGK